MGQTHTGGSVCKVTGSEAVWFGVCVGYMHFFLSLSLYHMLVFMLVCARVQCVLTGGSGGGNATSHTLRIHFHVSRPPSHLIVILVASAFKPTYANVFWGIRLLVL